MISRRFIPFLGILSFAIFGCNSDRRSRSFDTCAQVSKSDLAKGEWLPAELPNDCLNVQIEWDIDTNQTWMRMRVASGELEKLIPTLGKRVTPSEGLSPKDPSKIDWFEGFIEEQPANDAALHAVLYECSGESNAYYAISKTSDVVYFWRL